MDGVRKMRYNLESTLPINAFSPRGGRSPFNHGMTLEGGGGGGGVVGGITKGISSVVGGVTDAVKGIVQPIYNATLKQIPGVDNALVNLDKSVGKAIPGGWGTVASVAASFIPGGQLAAMSNGLLTPARLAVGLGALSGSGVMRGKHDFNLQGAIMGGAMAYGASEIAQGLQNASNPGAVAATEAAAKGGTEATNKVIEQQLAQNAVQNAPTFEASGYDPAFNPSGSGTPFDPTGGGAPTPPSVPNPNVTDPSYNPNLDSTGSGASPLPEPPPFDPNFDPTGGGTNSPGLKALADAGKGTLSNMADAGTGIKNLVGLGAESGTAAAAREAFMAPITKLGAAAGIAGYSGMAALEERQKQLDAQLAAGNIAQDQYNAELAKIEEQRAFAQKTVEENPLHASTDPSTVSNDPSLYNKVNAPIYASRSTGETLYDKNPYGGTQLLYAMGGSVSNPPDDQTGMPNQTPLQNFEHGGMYGLGGMAPNQSMSYPGYATGGLAGRFLSGGGDGMSDSIKANIGGTQEARLADGEFVIPADVVSHLGNGSSKAGAKQLYSMMDKVRKARTGRKSQGKQINPRKYIPA